MFTPKPKVGFTPSSLWRLAACAALALPVLAAGQPATPRPAVYATGFEAPAFVADTPLAGQDGWIAPPPLSPNAAVITADAPRQGKQTVRVWGGDLDHQDFINEVTDGYYDAIGSYRHAVNYDTGGTQVVRVSAHVRVDGAQTALGDNFFSASIGAIGVDDNGDSSATGELAISSDGHVYGYSGQDLVPTFLVSAPITLGEWHSLAVEVDFAALTYAFIVDDQLLGTFDFDSSTTSTVLRRGSILTYAAPDTETLEKADYTSYFDDFSIRVNAK